MRTCRVIEDGARCVRSHHAKGLCKAHYKQWQKHGTTTDIGVNRRGSLTCRVIEDGARCTRLYHARDFCLSHYERWRKYGTPLGFSPHGPRNKKRKVVGYVGAHRRLTRERGPASEQTCRCGEQAADWAYNHTDPNERTELTGHNAGYVFSLDPARYVPLCKLCHKTFDRGIALCFTDT
jgi:hypothetical protein